MTDIGALLGGTKSNRSAIEERMREVIAFEQAIAEVLCGLLQNTRGRTANNSRPTGNSTQTDTTTFYNLLEIAMGS